MKLSQESLLGLKRHFLGALSEPSPVWIVPAPGPRLLLASDGALSGSSGACVVDFGRVESPGEERRTLRVVNLDGEMLFLSLRNPNPWLSAAWQGNGSQSIQLAAGGAELKLVVAHDLLEETELAGSVELVAETLAGSTLSSDLLVRLATVRPHPAGRYDFQGSPEPRPYDFGRLDPAASGPESYSLSFENLTQVPLEVSFADLPAWLVFEVDGHQRRGPAEGRFFERRAPFRATVRPVRGLPLAGPQSGRLRMVTNDSRGELRQVDLALSARFEPSNPSVSTELPALARVAAGDEAAAAMPASRFRVQAVVAAVLFLLLMIVFLVLFKDILPG